MLQGSHVEGSITCEAGDEGIIGKVGSGTQVDAAVDARIDETSCSILSTIRGSSEMYR